MRNRLFLIIFIVSIQLLTIFDSQAQKKEKKPAPTYQPIENATPETAFPVAQYVFKNSLKCFVASFDFFNGELTSTFYNYSGLLAEKRALINLKINENNLMDVTISGVEKYDKNLGAWFPVSFPGSETYERIKIADLLRNGLADTALVANAKKSFFQDLDINSIFYSNASELAGERWFENYLKDQKVSWNATFIDLKKNKNNDKGFSYEERYVSTGYNVMADPDLSEIKFTIYKYTNSDKLVSAKKGAKLPLTGYCRELNYSDGNFFIVLTDNLDDKIQKKDVTSNKTNDTSNLLDSSEKLIKLKDLLDKGIITKEEFEKEKKKILGN